MLQLIYELRKNCCGRTEKSKVLQEVLADLKSRIARKKYDISANHCSTKMQTCIEWKYLKVSTISLLAVISLRFKELLMWGFESGGWVIPLGYPQATPTLPLLSMGRGEGWKFQTLGMSCIAAVERLYWKEEQCALKWIHKRGNW